MLNNNWAINFTGCARNHNRRAYAELRERELLPPAGRNVGSQDVNEYLRTREDTD